MTEIGGSMKTNDKTTDGLPRKSRPLSFDAEQIEQIFLPRNEWFPFPVAADRQAWEALFENDLNLLRKDFIMTKAEQLLDKEWPLLPVSLYMEFILNGNRKRYETPYFERRRRLATFVMAECMEYQGRFIEQIINGIWTICEESTWCIPAHAERINDDVLPRADRQSVGLFSCETAAVLAESAYLLDKVLEQTSPSLREHIRRQVIERVIKPVEKRNGFRWLSGENNWTPWCCSNVLGAALHFLDDPPRVARITAKLCEAVQRFIGNYPDDGGCNEGPGYWNQAAGAMLIFLEHLYSRSNGKISIYEHPKIAAMGRFIAAVHLDGPWCVNVADGPPHFVPLRGRLYRYGERIGDNSLKNLALLAIHNWKPDGKVEQPFVTGRCSENLIYMLRELFWIPSDAELKPADPPLHSWLPDIQIAVGREKNVPSTGFVLAAKGGHNDESHNHNDLGHFILLFNGQPVIVDLGSGDYTRKTFSKQRYEILWTRGLAHNAPVVNDCEQMPGAKRRATNVEFKTDNDAIQLVMNIESAYPRKAGLLELRRTIELSRTPIPEVRVIDTFHFKAKKNTIELNLYTPLPCRSLEKCGVVFGPEGEVVMSLEPESFDVDIEPFSPEGEDRTQWESLTNVRLRRHTDADLVTNTIRFVEAGT